MTWSSLEFCVLGGVGSVCSHTQAQALHTVTQETGELGSCKVVKLLQLESVTEKAIPAKDRISYRRHPSHRQIEFSTEQCRGNISHH